MRNRALCEVIDEDAHFRVIAKATVLLVETEMCRMEVYDQRRCASFELAKDVEVFGHYKAGYDQLSLLNLENTRDTPYGSGNFFAARLSTEPLSAVPFLVVRRWSRRFGLAAPFVVTPLLVAEVGV